MKNINNYSSAYYDELSKEYKSICNSRKKYLESINSIIRKYINLNEPKELLDIGTADGSRLMSILSKIDISINSDCLEPSQKMFLLCKKNELKFFIISSR